MRLDIGNAVSRITGLPRKIYSKLSIEFRIERPYSEWRHDQRLKYMYLIDKEGYFPSGLTNRVYNKVVDFSGESPSITDHRDLSPYREDAKYRKVRIASMPYTLRDYQKKAVLSILKNMRGTIAMATGTGKTMVMSAAILAYNLPTVILVGKTDLASQLREEIAEATGKEVGLIGKGTFDPKQVTVCLIQTLAGKRTSNSKKLAIKKIFKDTKVLICDEAHHAQAVTYQWAMEQFVNAGVRVGLTASPFASKVTKATIIRDKYGDEKIIMTKERQSEVILQLHTGVPIFEYSIRSAIKDGWLSKPEVIMYNFLHHRDRDDLAGVKYNSEYTENISFNNERNLIGCKTIADEVSIGGTVVVFVRAVDHGFELEEILTNTYGLDSESISFVHGQASGRKAKLLGFKQGKTKVLIGTSILNEGLNFLCTMGINMAAGDSDINVVQTLGRILRKPRMSSGDVDPALDRHVKFVDIRDRSHPWFSSHASSRIKMHKELGFEPKIEEI